MKCSAATFCSVICSATKKVLKNLCELTKDLRIEMLFIKQEKPLRRKGFLFLFVGADNGNRTHDLVITNDVLYRLSHISESNYRPCYYIKYGVVCQDLYAKILKIKFRSTVQIPAIIEERILKTKNLPYLISASGQSDII